MQPSMIIARTSSSKFAGPIHVVPKKSDDPMKQYQLVIYMCQMNELK